MPDTVFASSLWSPAVCAEPPGGRRSAGGRIVRALRPGLLAGLLAASAWAQEPAEDLVSLAREFQQAMAAQAWERAVTVAVKLAEGAPGDPVAHYNLACAISRNGDAERAMAALKRSTELGFRFLATFDGDADLDPLRELAGFDGLRDGVAENERRALERFAATIGDAPLLTLLPRTLQRGRPAPLIVALHGRGGTPEGLAPLYRGVAELWGAILVLPRGPLEQGPGFSWGALAEAELLVLSAIDRTREHHPVDPRRIVLSGFSQGAGVTFYVALRHPERFAGALPVAGDWDPRVVPLPSPLPERFPVFEVWSGAEDRVAEANRRAARRLEEGGVEVAVRMFPGVGHDYPRSYAVDLEKALRRMIGRPLRPDQLR